MEASSTAHAPGTLTRASLRPGETSPSPVLPLTHLPPSSGANSRGQDPELGPHLPQQLEGMDLTWGQRASGQLVQENTGSSGRVGAGETRGRRTASRAAAEEQVVPSGPGSHSNAPWHMGPVLTCCSCLSLATPWGEHTGCSQPCSSICNATPSPPLSNLADSCYPPPEGGIASARLPLPEQPRLLWVSPPPSAPRHAAHSLHRHAYTSHPSSAVA